MSVLRSAAWLKDFDTFREEFAKAGSGPNPEDLAAVLGKGCANKSLPDRLQIVRFLLEQGAPAGVKLEGGNTALHVMLSARKHDAKGEAELIPLFVEHGADLNAINNRRETPLLCLVLQRNLADAEIKPIVDAMLAQPGLDLSTEPYADKTVTHMITGIRPALGAELEKAGN